MKNQKKLEKILEQINAVAGKIKREVRLMEVCGTHTQAVRKFGIRELMPKNVKLVTGPGCPVCVTDQRDIDAVVVLARAGVPIATYGDVLRVPGSFGSLEKARREGAKVFPVYSVAEAVELKKEYDDLVFFGIGFETTAPMTAWGIKNGLTVYSAHKLFIPALAALATSQVTKIDGFIDPGHVSAIVGTEVYKDIKKPQVITGFEAEDVLVAIYLLLSQIAEGETEVENEYSRVVKKEGNTKAMELIFDVFEVGDGAWRGLGVIPQSGLEIKKKYKQFDAKLKYKDVLGKVDFSKSQKPTACRCGEVIQGIIDSRQCPMFGRACTPENPYGPCMVSVEGACNVEYRYE